jgi:hypothetical protein
MYKSASRYYSRAGKSVHWRPHVADQSVLRHRHESSRPAAIQILHQFMNVQAQRIFFGHRPEPAGHVLTRYFM